ncbi:MAG: hypothetical protein HOP34_03170 [Methylococcaceae bacterium]|nr:hypothetical protein [Methylococcaceae bacterium]
MCFHSDEQAYVNSFTVSTAHTSYGPIEDLEIPGFKLHSLKGPDNDRWSVWVNGNWRITLEFHDGHAFILDYEDYH